MKPIRRPSDGLVTETGVFFWMSSPLINVGPLQLEFDIVSMGGGLVCVRLICCRIILTASSPGRLLICLSLAPPFPSRTTFAFRSREVRLLLVSDPYGGTDPLGMFPLFIKRPADVLLPSY